MLAIGLIAASTAVQAQVNSPSGVMGTSPAGIGIGTVNPYGGYGVRIYGGIGRPIKQGLFIQRADNPPTNQDGALKIAFSSALFTTPGLGLAGGTCGFILKPTSNSLIPDMAFSTDSIVPQLVIKHSGFVGIGTAAPISKLEVFGGDARINGITVGLGSGFIGTNTVVGKALGLNTTGFYNTAVGASVLTNNSTGYRNTAMGYQSMLNTTTGYYNSAYGVNSLNFNTTGSFNTAIGDNSMVSSSNAYANTALGQSSMYYITSGQYNAAGGNGVLQNITTGSYNAVFGANAFLTNSTGSNNTGIGYGANVAVDGLTNTTAVGNGTIATASNEVFLGNTNVTAVRSAAGVYTTSDGRFKKNIQGNVRGLDFINALKPVTYNYDVKKMNDFITPVKNEKNIDKTNETATPNNDLAVAAKEKILYSGFIAQEVDEAAKKSGYQFSGVHIPQNDKDVYALNYSEFVVPLVKSVQELSKQNDELKSMLASLQSQIDALKNVSVSSSDSKMEANINNVTGAQLYQVAPNPFSQKATISFKLPSNVSNAQLVIADATGKTVKTYKLSNGSTQQDVYANNLAAGVYHYSLVVNGKMMESKQMVITK